MDGNNTTEKWYVLHTYSGHEYKVRDRLMDRAKRLGVTDQILTVLVPDQDTVEEKGNKRKIVQKKCFPGYVLVKVLVSSFDTKSGTEYKMNSDIWYVIKNTDGVSGFVGDGKNPVPISDLELDAIKKRMVRYESMPEDKLSFESGEKVEIIMGSFIGSCGHIDVVDHDHKKLIVNVDIFNRQTPIEVKFNEVRKID